MLKGRNLNNIIFDVLDEKFFNPIDDLNNFINFWNF